MAINIYPNYNKKLSDVNNQLADIENQKANQSDLDTANANIALKANQSALDITNTNVTNLGISKADKSEVTNVMTPKGNIAYASLPTSGNTVGWYYYCADGDGTHGAGNYVWNGTAWYFGGTGDEGYSILNGKLGDLSNNIGGVEIVMRQSYYINNSVGIGNVVNIDAPTYSTAWRCGVVECAEGDTFMVSGTGGLSPRLWAFLDSTKKIICVADANAVSENLTVVAPANAVYFVINDSANKTSYYYSQNSISKQVDFLSTYNEDLDTIDMILGSYLDLSSTKAMIGNPIVSAGYRYTVVPCKQDDEFIINGQAGNAPRLWAFIDISSNIISVANESASANNLLLVAPANAVYLIINNAVDAKSYRINSNYFIDKKPSNINSKHILIAASNSSYRDKKIADYVCTGTHDEQIISQAINSLTYGGTVEFCDGNYEIQDYYATEYDLYYGIYVSNTGYDRRIVLKGRTRNRWYFSEYGCIFHFNVSALDVTKQYTLFGGSAYKTADTLHTWTAGMNDIEIENISFKVSGYDKKVIGIDLRHFGLALLKNVIIENDNSTQERYNGGTVSVPCEGMIGLYSMKAAQTTQIFTNVIINSFREGFHMEGAEHAVLTDCAACRCVYGYVFNATTKAITMINCSDEGNTFLPKFIGSGTITMIDMNIENLGSYPVIDGVTERYATEDTAGGWTGDISYRLEGDAFGSSNVHYFAAGQGVNIKVRNLKTPLSGTTKPINKDYLAQFFDTVSNKMLTWNGTNWVDGTGAVVS